VSLAVGVGSRYFYVFANKRCFATKLFEYFQFPSLSVMLMAHPTRLMCNRIDESFMFNTQQNLSSIDVVVVRHLTS
jgi:hypothetical protein